MKFLRIGLLAALAMSLFIGCFEDDDDNITTDQGALASEIHDFIWKGMNVVYLYKPNIPNLANNRFTTDKEYADYLNSYDSPEELFESLIHQRSSIDRFSWIVDDYIALEQFFDGKEYSNGMEYGFGIRPGTTNQVYGFVQYIIPETDAESEGLERGDLFYAVDGEALYYNSQFDNNLGIVRSSSIVLNMAEIDDKGTTETTDDTIEPSGINITLVEEEKTINPIYLSNIFDVGGQNVGYLNYTGFRSGEFGQFKTQLINEFNNFKSNNITDLILDLRYNPGGSVYLSILLSSMVTGQFTGEIFSTEQWNPELQAQFQDSDPELLINRFLDSDQGSAIPFLGLDKVYVLTTSGSASASEGVINSLDPYIDVVQIGTTTSGKYQASITVYDSPNLGRDGANPNHTYAMQPLVLKSLNAVGRTDYFDGIDPDIEFPEAVSNLGILGDLNEPLLKRAIEEIEASRSPVSQPQGLITNIIGDKNDLIPFGKEMYIEKELPESIKEKLKIQ